MPPQLAASREQMRARQAFRSLDPHRSGAFSLHREGVVQRRQDQIEARFTPADSVVEELGRVSLVKVMESPVTLETEQTSDLIEQARLDRAARLTSQTNDAKEQKRSTPMPTLRRSSKVNSAVAALKKRHARKP